jgi:hypothetical protein
MRSVGAIGRCDRGELGDADSSKFKERKRRVAIEWTPTYRLSSSSSSRSSWRRRALASSRRRRGRAAREVVSCVGSTMSGRGREPPAGTGGSGCRGRPPSRSCSSRRTKRRRSAGMAPVSTREKRISVKYFIAESPSPSLLRHPYPSFLTERRVWEGGGGLYAY